MFSGEWAPNAIVGSIEPLAQQHVMDARHPQPIAPMPRVVLRQQRVETFLERPDPLQRLNRAVVTKRPLGSVNRLADHLAR